MPELRLIVRPRYGGPEQPQSYQVVANSTVLSTHASRAEAARAVLALGGRMALTWTRTVIGGEEGPFDFTAAFGDIKPVGRIYRELGTTHSAASWSWSMTAYVGGRFGNAHGREPERLDAAAKVERAFTEMLARPLSG